MTMKANKLQVVAPENRKEVRFHAPYSGILGVESKKEGKDQKSMQSRTTPDPGHHIGK